MLQTPLARISTALAALVIAWALARGRWPERAAALAIAVDWFGSIAFQDHRRFHHGQPAWVALDLAQGLALLGLAVGCRRTWVLWAAAFGALLVVTHAAFMLNPRFGQWGYMSVIYVWSFGLLGALAAGTALEGRRSAPPAGWVSALMAARQSTPSATARTRS